MSFAAPTTCMQCYSEIGVDKPAIRKLASFAKEKRDIQWVQIYEIPSYVIFSHRAHLSTGNTCTECHGQVQEREQLYREGNISMARCVNCHSAKKASIDCTYCHEK